MLRWLYLQIIIQQYSLEAAVLCAYVLLVSEGSATLISKAVKFLSLIKINSIFCWLVFSLALTTKTSLENTVCRGLQITKSLGDSNLGNLSENQSRLKIDSNFCWLVFSLKLVTKTSLENSIYRGFQTT